MDDGMKMRAALAMKTVQSCYSVAVVLGILAVAVFAWGLSVLLNNSGCKTCAIDGSSFVVMPLMFVMAMVGLIAALAERGEVRFVMGALDGEEKKRLRRMNKVRLVLGLVPLCFAVLEFVITFIFLSMWG